MPGERVLTFSELFAKLSRPEMLEGVRPAYVQGTEHADKHNSRAQRQLSGSLSQRLVVILVGLPARGKSYISHRLVNYMNWYIYYCCYGYGYCYCYIYKFLNVRIEHNNN